MYYNLIRYTYKENDSIITNEAIQHIDSNGVVFEYIDLQGNVIELPSVCESEVITVEYTPNFNN